VNASRGKLLERRASLLAVVRAFFVERGFLEVETPLLVPSPGLDVHLAAFEVPTTAGRRFLSTSPEYQMKRLLAAGYAAIFQITKAFRKDELGERHSPEFTMLEWYRAGATVEDVMRETEELVAKVTGGHVQVGGRSHSVRPPFRRMTVIDAYAEFAGHSREETLDMAEHDEERFFRLLLDKVEPGISELGTAVFLTEYPASQASLARNKPKDPRVAERFELYVAGVELCNGFGELTDPAQQRARFRHDLEVRSERGLPMYPIDERFLDALEQGLPPCAGNALGIDRLVALACGTREIRDVMAFADDEL
jgi:lysyl-tRNA synthetase class 2